MVLEACLAAILVAASGAPAAPSADAAAAAHAPPREAGGAEPEGRPALAVVLSVDQFPSRYLARFAPLFGRDGFEAFQRGAVFEASRYPYATTFTCPGHAAIGTGLPPSQSGIVGNAWYVRGPAGKLARTYCVDDPRTELVTAVAGKVTPLPRSEQRFSPVNLSGDALGDRLVESHPRSRVIAVALKDRAAILMGGRTAHAAYWYSEELHRFVSSRYYPGLDPTLLAHRTDCVTWGASFSACRWKAWSPRESLGSGLAAAGVYDTPETEPFEKVPDGLERVGQDAYRIRSANGLLFTPYGNTLLLDFARRVVEVERLGRRGTPDLLYVGLSSMDYVGHQFGPDSAEVADTVKQLDRDLASFVEDVTAAVGEARVTFVLTSDHGVQAVPAVARARARREGRSADVGEVASSQLVALAAEAAVAAVRATYGKNGGRPVARFEEPGLWLDWSALSAVAGGPVDAARVRTAVRDALAPGKVDGVSGAWSSDDLLAPCARGAGPDAGERLRICEAVRASFRSDRSPDVTVTLRPGWIWRSDAATTHGQPVPDDMEVPLVFWGAGIVRGLRSAAAASPLDIAPTLGALLGIEAGRRDARPLPCLAEPARRAAGATAIP